MTGKPVGVRHRAADTTTAELEDSSAVALAGAIDWGRCKSEREVSPRLSGNAVIRTTNQRTARRTHAVSIGAP